LRAPLIRHMSQAILDRLLKGTLPDPDGTETLSVPVKSIVIGRGLAAAALPLLRNINFGNRLAAVMDPATWAVLGRKVIAALGSEAEIDEVILPRQVHPEMPVVREVMTRTAGADALLAIGSGTINDIVKYAAHLAGKPYVVFGTAPSMNGYTSASAAITERGLKKSLPATLPVGVFLDLDVMATAPRRLIAAGFGDSMARNTAQTDWLMAHLILGSAYRELPFALLAEDEEALVENATALKAGDTAVIERLVRTLVLSGLGMTLCGGSYPASQSEHLIAHYIDMRGQNLPAAYHGEHIAVTTLTMARMQESILSRPQLVLTPPPDSPQEFIRIFGPELGETCWQAFRPKLRDSEAMGAINRKLAREWPAMRERLCKVGRPSRQIEKALNAIGAPTKPHHVGIPTRFYSEAVANARLIRDRYTMLDIGAAIGAGGRA
jgi:glycerol-1-phosphate dehydrogenase [NAD(P)+]